VGGSCEGPLDDARDALVRPCAIEQPAIVDGAKAIERVRLRRVEAGGLEGALNQQPRSLAHHAGDRIRRERASAVALEHLVGALREIQPGVDQRAVEVEDDESGH
jgi:hypothetical protein